MTRPVSFEECVEDILTRWSTPETTPEEREAMRYAAEDRATWEAERDADFCRAMQFQYEGMER